MNNILGRFGIFLFIPAMAACAVHFPKLASVGALFALGPLAEYEEILFYGLHVLIVAMWVGHLIDFNKSGAKVALVLISISVAFFALSLYVQVSETLSYVALFVLAGSSAVVWFVPHLEGSPIES